MCRGGLWKRYGSVNSRSVVVTTRRRRQRKQPQRLDPHPAGSDRAIELVRGFILQQQRVRAQRARDREHAMLHSRRK